MLHCLGRLRASSRGIHFLTRPRSKSIRVLIATTYKLPVMSSRDSDSPPAPKPWFSGFGMPSLRRLFSTPAESGDVRDRKYYEKLTVKEKRKLYTCGSAYKTLADIPTWEEFQKGKPRPKTLPQSFAVDSKLNQKVSLWQGDITQLEIDAIVNAANSSLLGGGGVDGAIHRAAGPSLRDECATLGGCSTGEAKLSSGHRLPAKYILHTVGPMTGSERQLRSCYTECLQLVSSENIRSVAFCCIATGIYGYPNEDAAHVALGTIRKWLESDDNADKVDRIIFCVFLRKDYSIYQKLLHQYFPLPPPPETDLDEGGTPPPEDSNNGGGSAEQRDGGGRESDTIPKMERSITEPAHSAALRSTLSDQQQLPPNHEPPAKKQNREQDKKMESELKEEQHKKMESEQDKMELELKEEQDKKMESELKEQEETPDQEPRAEATA